METMKPTVYDPGFQPLPPRLEVYPDGRVVSETQERKGEQIDNAR